MKRDGNETNIEKFISKPQLNNAISLKQPQHSFTRTPLSLWPGGI